MKILSYKDICRQVQEIARETGKFIRNERKTLSDRDVELKGSASLVTYVDKTAERKIVEALKKIIPESGFITEEGTVGYSGERLIWIVDPLDGTTNYIHDIAPHSVSIALQEEEEITLGVVYEIGQSEMFYAWKDSPAFLNGEQIAVSPNNKIENALIGTGFPYYNFDKVENYIDAMRYFMEQTRGLRRLGSAAVDLSYVAAGRFDGFFEHGLHAWDVAAGVFILKQAGGKVSDFNGGENWLFGGELIAASGNFFDEFYATVHKHLGSTL